MEGFRSQSNRSEYGNLLAAYCEAVETNAPQEVIDAIETEVVQAEEFDYTY